jgi:hypothetical protein
MKVEEIKKAVDDGLTVHWANELYTVIKDKIGQYLIHCRSNDHCIGLTWMDNTTLNGDETEFYIKPS